MNRRQFLGNAAKTALAFGFAPGILKSPAFAKEDDPVYKTELKKAIVFSMVQGESVQDKFKIARDAGFDGIEAPPLTDPVEIEAMVAASRETGVEIHSVIYGGWGKPLSAADPQAAAEGVQSVKEGLAGAKAMGAGCFLLVPGVVNAQNRYADVYDRTQDRIKKCIHDAEKNGVPIAIENVWNNFLLSPLEFARYVDEFKSPWVRAYFDVGNVVVFGWPEDWLRTLGKRIHRIHIKDFKKDTREWKDLRDGDVNWLEVRKAIDEIGYSGYLTAELRGGNLEYLKEVASRMDKIIAGE